MSIIDFLFGKKFDHAQWREEYDRKFHESEKAVDTQLKKEHEGHEKIRFKCANDTCLNTYTLCSHYDIPRKKCATCTFKK